MPKLADFAGELREVIDEHRRAEHIPGVSLAVRAGDEVVECAAGVLNLDTGVEVTPDSLFQIGSITKTFTATLVMQLVDEGLVDLDKPVRGYVPEFSLADPEAAETVTVRQLLCHMGGFEGDVFDDFGRGDDAVARYVKALENSAQTFPPGSRFSYCNSGFSVLGRLVERLRDVPSWDDALRRQLIEPLGLTYTVSLAEQAMLFRTAVGHVAGEGNDAAAQRVASRWQLPRSTAPAGATLCARARDLLEWTRFHLDGGLAADGTRLLSAAATAAMRETQTVLPPFEDGFPHYAWGLGWRLADFDGGRTFGHGGSTIGQIAMLDMVPESAVGFAVLTNGGSPARLIHALRTRVFREFAGIEVPALPEPPSRPVDVVPERFVGRYQDAATYYDVRRAVDGGLEVEVGVRGVLKDQLEEEPKTYRMTGYSPVALITSEPDDGVHWRLSFPDTDADGRATALFDGTRLTLRAEETE